ncbi:MAG: c-type cytochrome [Acidobacteriota bacterium]
MAHKSVSVGFAALALTLILFSFSPQPATADQRVERGRKLYLQYCASCHGVDGRGNGPVAPNLKTPPPDLTAIPKKDGKFPGVRVRLIIEGEVGETELTSHGTREMPVWGMVFRKKTGDKTFAMLNSYALTKYIEAIQRPDA